MVLENFSRTTEFYPTSVNEFIALRLATKLGDLGNLNWYLRLFFDLGHGQVVSRARAFDEISQKDLAGAFRGHFRS